VVRLAPLLVDGWSLVWRAGCVCSGLVGPARVLLVVLPETFFAGSVDNVLLLVRVLLYQLGNTLGRATRE